MMIDILILLIAGFLAGGLNAIAGGGSFLTLPALAYVGLPLIAANATGTTALLPGYLSSTWAFRHDLRTPMILSIRQLTLVAFCGGALGAALLMVTSEAAFKQLVPWLLLAATSFFAFGNRWISVRQRESEQPLKGYQRWGPCGALFAVTVYGGYFNGGLGILLLAVFVLLGEHDLNAMNGAKNWVSAVLTAIAVILYALNDAVVWPYALLMMVASTVGGYLGGRLARRLPVAIVRGVVVATGLVMSILFFLQS